MLIRENPRAFEIYQKAMDAAWAAKNELLDTGRPTRVRSYLRRMPKRFDWWSRAPCFTCCTNGPMRTCFNAQEEIYQASMDEVVQVRAAFPESRRPTLLSPRPSPEGSHFCGVKVWLDFPSIQRRI